MTEAQVTCLCTMIRLPDLGLVLVKEQVVYLDEDKARASKDLENARRVGGVEVKYVVRCQERVGENHMLPVDRGRMPAKAPASPPEAPPPEPVPPETVDLEALTARFRAGLCSREDVEKIIQSQVQKAVAEILGPLTGLSQTLKQAMEDMKNAPSRSFGGIVQAEAQPMASPEMPRFIPDGLVNPDLEADISVKEDTFEGGGVDAATKALRKMRTKKSGGRS